MCSSTTHCFSLSNTYILNVNTSSSRDYGTYHIGDQWRLRQACSPQPLLFAHMKYGSRWRVRRKVRCLAPLDGCAWAIEKWVYGGWKEALSPELAHMISLSWIYAFGIYPLHVWNVRPLGTKCKSDMVKAPWSVFSTASSFPRRGSFSNH